MNRPQRVAVILEGTGGELERQELEISADCVEASVQIYEAIDEWILAPGDTIRIVEVSP